MTEPAVTNELLIVQQELAFARAELAQLAAALDELEVSNVPQPGKEARLLDRYGLAKAAVKDLTSKLAGPQETILQALGAQLAAQAEAHTKAQEALGAQLAAQAEAQAETNTRLQKAILAQERSSQGAHVLSLHSSLFIEEVQKRRLAAEEMDTGYPFEFDLTSEPFVVDFQTTHADLYPKFLELQPRAKKAEKHQTAAEEEKQDKEVPRKKNPRAERKQNQELPPAPPPFTIGGNATFSSEKNVVQPLATILLCFLLAQFVGDIPLRHQCVDIHSRESKIWKPKRPDKILYALLEEWEQGVGDPNFLNPSNVTVILELKASDSINDAESLAQLIQYLDIFLSKSPCRTFVYGLLTDLHTGILVKAEKLPPDDVRDFFTVFSPVAGRALVGLLRAILANDPNTHFNAGSLSLQFDGGEIENGDFHVQRRLGRGATGEVIEVKRWQHDQAFALKGCFTGATVSADVLRTELQLLQEAAKLENLYVYHGMVASASINDVKNIIVMDVCLPNNPDVWNVRELINIVDAVREIHNKLHIIHRDLRPCNFVVQGNRPVIIDFGCAVAFGEGVNMQPYCGSRCYANFRFLPLEENLNELYQFTPADDLASLVLTAFAIFHTPEGDIELCPGVHVPEIQHFWATRLPPVWSGLLFMLEGQRDPYATVTQFFQASLPPFPLWAKITCLDGAPPTADRVYANRVYANWVYANLHPRNFGAGSKTPSRARVASNDENTQQWANVRTPLRDPRAQLFPSSPEL